MTKTIHSDAQRALCEALVAARLRAGQTQTGLAAALRCHQSMIARLESGQRRIDVVELVIVCRALGVEPGEILAAVAPSVPEGAGL